MSIRAKKGSSAPKELIKSGSHIARCISIVHIGTIEDEYMGTPKILDKIIVTWELPNYIKVFKEEEGAKPFVISKKYTLSMYKKANLRGDTEGWRGKAFNDKEAEDFDVAVLIAQPCMLSIIEKEKQDGDMTNNISSISMIPQGMKCPPQVNKSFEFNYDDRFDLIWLEEQPDWLKGMIKSTPEYAERMGQLESSAHDKVMESQSDATQGSDESELPSPKPAF